MQTQAPAAPRGFFGGGLGGAPGTVAATAAGLAGGAFLFQGIERLMHSVGASRRACCVWELKVSVSCQLSALPLIPAPALGLRASAYVP
jgi:hypothetical protein